ncbi:DUF1853 family protein [Luteirhabdus pelagi]|uniref:DUF1853 family protein n=1 Tax=Luteirhabdus pelagi TaxID=2792783 RepID=UPI00193A9976|nr:DUF1853 family protein [Luteirhabdus pelagi]
MGKKGSTSEGDWTYFQQGPELKVSEFGFPFETFSVRKLKVSEQAFQFPSQLMLGKQAEYCFEFMVKHSDRYELLAANIQIQGEEQTLGELDYLLYDSEIEKNLHVELACKFYLFDESLGDRLIEKWIGPNRKDRLVEKLQKLKQHQFPLLYSEATEPLLESLQLQPSTIEQQLCLKSFLFLPKGMEKSNLPEAFSDCVIGRHITIDDFTPKNYPGSFYLPQKKEWLLSPESHTTWISFGEAKRQLDEKLAQKRSALVYHKTNKGIELFFVRWW